MPIGLSQAEIPQRMKGKIMSTLTINPVTTITLFDVYGYGYGNVPLPAMLTLVPQGSIIYLPDHDVERIVFDTQSEGIEHAIELVTEYRDAIQDALDELEIDAEYYLEDWHPAKLAEYRDQVVDADDTIIKLEGLL